MLQRVWRRTNEFASKNVLALFLFTLVVDAIRMQLDQLAQSIVNTLNLGGLAADIVYQLLAPLSLVLIVVLAIAIHEWWTLRKIPKQPASTSDASPDAPASPASSPAPASKSFTYQRGDISMGGQNLTQGEMKTLLDRGLSPDADATTSKVVVGHVPPSSVGPETATSDAAEKLP